MRYLAFLLTGCLIAAPTIRDIQPRGAQSGTRFTLVVSGEGLTPDARIETKLPGTVSRMVPAKMPDSPNSQLPLLIELQKDAPVGLYPLRIVTQDGVSNLVLFSVSPFQEIEEAEVENPKQRNDNPETAESLQAPLVVNGTLEGADVDIYKLAVKPGQKLVFEVEARRAGSAIDPAFEILDGSGKAIVKVDDSPGAGVDCRTEVAFPKAGTYFVRVHDARYSDQIANFYRLKIGLYPYADSAFPLGWKHGEEIEVTLTGGNLPASVKVKAGPELRLPGSAALPLPFLTSDRSEILEDGSGRLPEGVVLNGQIAKPGEIDQYRVPVKPGEQWVFEAKAATLGTSQLDPLVTLTDASGKKLASRDDVAGADPALPFTVPEGATELIVNIEDLLGRGGPGFAYRLEARRQAPDFTVDLLTPFVNVPAGGTAQVVAAIQRRGYDGPLRLTIEGLPEGFTFAGGHVPSEAAAQSFNDDNAGFRSAAATLTVTAPEDAPPLVSELKIIAVGGGIRKIARTPGIVTPVRGSGQRPFTGSWLNEPLLLATTKPLPLTVSSPTPMARLSQGFEFPIVYRLKRRPGVPAPSRINARVVGAVGNLRVLATVPGKTPDTGTILLATNFATPVTTFDMVLEAQTQVNGRPATISSPAISIDVVPGYQVELERSELAIVPGSRAQIRGKVHREPTFEGSFVKLDASELPEHVRCTPVEVPDGQRDFLIACEAGAAAVPGAYEIQIRSVAPDTGRKAKDEYKIADVPAKLIVGSQVQAAR
jgi:hypothetical protein